MTKLSLLAILSSWLKKRIGSRKFVKKVATIALPIYLSTILLVLVNIIDSTMIAPLGTDKLASVNAAGEINFFALATTMGFLQMGFIYFTQFHGKSKDSFEVKSSLTISVYCAILWTIFLVILVQFFSRQFISIFLSNKTNIETGAGYLKIVSLSWIVDSIIIAIVWGLGRIGKPILAIGVTITSLIMNVTLNYLFINGIEVPKLGVNGVALSTLISRVIELGVAITILIIFQVKEFFGFLLPKYWSFKIFKKIITKWLILFNEVFWVLSLIFQFGLTTHRGDDAAAVIGSAHVISQVLFAIHGGFAGVVGYFIGRSLGANKLEYAKEISGRLLRLVILVSFLYSLFFIIISYGIVKSFSVTSSSTIGKGEFELYLLYTILMLGIMNISFSTELVFINSLWAGGKVGQGFIGDVVTNWIINAVASLATYFTNIHYLAIYAILSISDLFKSFTLYFLFLKYDWVRNIVGVEQKSKLYLWFADQKKKLLKRRRYEHK